MACCSEERRQKLLVLKSTRVTTYEINEYVQNKT
jgi:hypothetical protein